MSITKQIEKEARKYFDEKGAHDMTHTKRVLKVALEIAKYERDVDLIVLKAACLLHDIARKKEDKEKFECHAKEGAKIAEKILKRLNFPKEKIKGVVHAIRCHRKSKGIKAETIEAKILQDADKIDIFGAIGIGRTFSQHSKNMVIHSDYSRKLSSFEDYNTDSILEMLRSLLLVKKNKFNTKGGWEIVQERLNFLNLFIRQFEKEWV